MNAPAHADFTQLAHSPSLDRTTAEAALTRLLDAVRDDQVPTAARQEMHRFYDRFQPWRNHFLHHFAPFLCKADSVFEVQSTHPHLLDLGCGVATQAHLLAMRGATIAGLDNNSYRVEAGRSMSPWFAEQCESPRLPVTLAADDAFAWLKQQPSGAFDGCYTQFALAYMRPHDKMLELIDRVVRPGGRILFREFNAGSVYNRVVSRVDWLSAHGYQRVAARLGWRCQECEYCWLIPRRVINWAPTRQALSSLESRLTRLPGVGDSLAAAMTLVFEK